MEYTTPFTLLTADAGEAIAAAGTWQKASKYSRTESHPHLMFFVEYTPVASEEAADTVELNIQVLFTPTQPAENAAIADVAWKVFTVEAARGSPPAGTSEVQPAVKRWTIDSAQADPGSSISPNPLRSFSFEVTLPARCVTLEFNETGHDGAADLGTVKAWVAHGNW